MPRSTAILRSRSELRRRTRSLSNNTFSTTLCGLHPLVDVAPLFCVGSPSRRETVQAIGAAMGERGYFYCENVDILPAEYIRSVYQFSQRMHALPVEVKKAFSQRGSGSYTGADIGEHEIEYEVGVKASACSWDYSPGKFTLGTESPRYPGEDIIQPTFESVLTELYARQNTLAKALLGAFEEALGLPRSTFVDMFQHDNLGTVRLIRYPGVESTAGATDKGIGAHTDFEVFTLMHQDAPGLQFMPRHTEGDFQWVDAPVRPGEFVVIVGDVLERFTNGTWLATPHRVLQTTHARSSIIRFNAVAPDVLVEPLPQFISDENPPKYTPVTMATHMETTMRNIDKGLGAWDEKTNRSTTATYRYINGVDHRLAN